MSAIFRSGLFLALLAAPAAKASCLPEISQLKLPAKIASCDKDSDCVLAGDACRSCANPPLAIHQKFAPVFLAIDRAAREKANCVLTCEACSKDRWQLSCIQSKCQASIQN